MTSAQKYIMSVSYNSGSGSTVNAYAASAVKALSLELKKLQNEPTEGFHITPNEDNLLIWTVGIFGPPNTIYQGGYFRAQIRFPNNYPYSPPTFKFLNKIWHPNVYDNGDLCISILHPPVNDPQSGELPSERWNPTQNVRTIMMSVISLLNEPNTSSPANVDASVMYKKWKDTKGADDEYARIIKKQVELSKEDAKKNGIIVPETVEEYIVKPKLPENDAGDMIDMDDDYDHYDDYGYSDDDDFEESDEDSGQGEN
uniref:UBIQUITIN_CONJUGAT_2 domain-containing protein n=1 Tax=Strongyloides stercoralis TaxID=6248 RepID=A0A0K0DWE1_STRER